MDREEIIGIDALYDSMIKCSKGVKWKGTVAYYRHHWTDEIAKLSEELHNGTYTERKAHFFTITEPKVRNIMSIHFRDRIYQRSLNDTAIYPQVVKSFIAENFACQKGKGTDAARDCLKRFLHRFYQMYKTDGYVLKIDIKGYYPNMRHDFAEKMLREYIDDETYQMAQKVLARLPGDIGYNPGSQIVQIVGVTALDKIDHIIKDELGIELYIRYMDDFVLIHRDKSMLEQCLDRIKRELSKQEMEVHPSKTFIQPITSPIKFLGFIYCFSSTGKLIISCDPKKVKHERKKIARMVTLVKKGKRTKRDVDAHFKSYKSSIRYGCSHNLIHRLNVWYESLWERTNDEEEYYHETQS